MRTRKTVVASVAFYALFVPVWSFPGAAASEPAKPGLEKALSTSRVDWQPAGDAEGLVLTVAGPGDLYLREEFPAGTSPFLSLLKRDGSPLPDGRYTYEIRGARPSARPIFDSGYLVIRNGSFVVPPSRPGSDLRSGTDKDIINDALTVTGELIVYEGTCIGTSCAAGDSNFGLKLKDEASFQIYFDDVPDAFTNVHDWAIRINDFIGPGEYFAIKDVEAGTVPFTIEGDAPDNALYVRSNGSLGLGTSTPASRFHLFENADANTILTVENPSTGLSAAGVLRAKSNTATVNFQAHGSGRTTSRFGQTLASWAEFLQVTGNGLILGTLESKPLILGTNSTNRVHITGTGSVGIGTTSPTSLLHVNGGDIRVQGGSFIDDGVTLNAPDYVFEPDYRLMPIEDLKEFIARERHLPNVPSAAEIKEQGLNLSQFQMRLLEKIEELALYTVTQHEQIQAQQARIDDLQGVNAELSERLEALEKAAGQR